MTIDVPINDMNHSLLGHNQLTTIDHTDLSAHLGLSLGGGGGVSKSPDQPLSTTPSPSGSLQDEDMEDFRQVSVMNLSISIFLCLYFEVFPSVSENHAGRLFTDHVARAQPDWFRADLHRSSSCCEKDGW